MKKLNSIKNIIETFIIKLKQIIFYKTIKLINHHDSKYNIDKFK